MAIHAIPTMPDGLEGFPWKDSVCEWSCDWHAGRATRIVVWYQPERPDVTPQEFVWEATKMHLAAWSWLAERFVLSVAPSMATRGLGPLRNGLPASGQVQCLGTFELDEPEQPQP